MSSASRARVATAALARPWRCESPQAARDLVTKMDYARDGSVSWAELVNWVAFDDDSLRALAMRLRMHVARDLATGALAATEFKDRLAAARAEAGTRSEDRGKPLSARSARSVVKAVTGAAISKSEAVSLLRFLSADSTPVPTVEDAADPRPRDAPAESAPAATLVEGLCDFLQAHLEDCFTAEPVDVS